MCVCVCVCVCVLVAQSYLTLCNPMDCSPPGSSVDGILQERNTGVGCHALLQGKICSMSNDEQYYGEYNHRRQGTRNGGKCNFRVRKILKREHLNKYLKQKTLEQRVGGGEVTNPECI